MNKSSGKIIGLFISILSLLISAILSVGLLALNEYVPLLFSSLNYSGVLIIEHSIPQTLINIGSLTLGIHFLLISYLEKYFKLTLVRASAFGIIPWIVFIVIVLLFPKGDYFAYIITLIFSSAILISSILIYTTTNRNTSGSLIRFFSSVFGFVLLLIGVLSPIVELFNSHKLLSSFPNDGDFNSRLSWTNNFFLENQSIQQSIHRKLGGDEEALKGNLAFVKGRIHTVVIDWMDGPQVSASFESQDGNILELCRGDKLECELASKKQILN